MSELSSNEKRLQEKLNKLNTELEKYKKRESILLNSLKKKESLFQKELNAQINLIRQSWSWRLVHLFIRPIEFFQKVSNPLLKSLSKVKRNILYLISSEPSEIPDQVVMTEDYDFEDQITRENNINIASIFDKFTESCFNDEFNIIRFTPQNWKKVLQNIPVQGFFIESAWRGVGATWRNKVVNISSYNQHDLFKLIKWIKQQQIPAIFWNKEDPVHFGDFLTVAKEFDYIFTTDADCIPDYQEAAGHSNVFALPFAAQPVIHNPVRESVRSGSVCFAGTYYNKKYAERQVDMDLLLKPALEFGLDIYDRNYGTPAERAGIYRFPDEYQSSIKGRLEYDDMVKAYKNYKVFLNVNSVKFSPTMFARRVFELLACGTPVISTYSQGIVDILGEDIVLITESENDTRDHLQSLIHDQEYWWKISLTGLRKVMQFHTYKDRTGEIFNKVGLPFEPYMWSSFTVVSIVNTLAEALYIKEICDAQIYRDFEIILLEKPSSAMDQKERQTIREVFGKQLQDIIPLKTSDVNGNIQKANTCDYLAFFDPHCYYGINYLLDYAIAVRYANPLIIGKKSFFTVKNNQPVIIHSGHEYTYSSSVPVETLAIHHSKLKDHNLNSFLSSDQFKSDGNEILSVDPYNFFLSDGAQQLSQIRDKYQKKIDL